MKIELILLGIIGVVFLIDFLMKGVRKKTESNDMVKADEEEVNIPKQRKARYIYYLYAFIVSLAFGILWTYLVRYFNWEDSFIEFINGFDSPSKRNDYINNFTISFILSFILTGLYVSQITVTKIFFSYLGKRKKNITLFIISSSVIKLCIHYFMYTEYISPRKWKNSNGNTVSSSGYFEYFTYHVENIFNTGLEFFIPALIICLLLVWFFNDKIKAR